MIGYQLSVRATRDPDAIAVVYGARRHSYAALEERARRLANGLATLGVRRGDRVAALLYNCDTFIEALFAAAKLGAIFVPLNFRLVPREIALQLKASTPALLIAGKELAGSVVGALSGHASLPREHIVVDDAPDGDADANYEGWLAAQSPAEPAYAAAAEDPLMLMHSSGTTGLPKGVVFTHSSVFASCTAKIVDFGLTAQDSTVVFGPLFHAGPLMDLALPLLMRGGRLVIGPSRHFDPAQLLRTIASERPTVVPIYPTMLRRVLATPDAGDDLGSLRLIVTGGEATPLPVIRAIHERFPHVSFINNYGSTEAGPVTTFLDPRNSLRKAGSVGKEAFGVEVRIGDEFGCAQPPGVAGEILVRSPFVCRGYWNCPEATAASTRDGWWRTGDLAFRDDEGFIWISGRAKELIKSGTESIFPIEVEQALAEHPAIQEAAVIGVPDADWGEAVAAFVVTRNEAAIDAEQVIEHCRSRIAGYKKPRHVVFVESLPRGTTSKVSKQALRTLWSSTRSA